jgi:transcriptional regulator with XRE-family HTH domain
MDIGKRLRELREAKGLSQGDIARRSGLVRSYLLRIECGHAAPKLGVLEKWTKAMGIPLYVVFLDEIRIPRGLAPARREKLSQFEKRLYKLMQRMDLANRELFVSFARLMAEEKARKSRAK